MSPERELTPLDAGDMLQSEFTYIAQTAFQANEDRARVTTFYLVNLGGLVAALVSSQLSSSLQPEVGLLFGILFTILSISGLLTILQLVRLRIAWRESARAMNRIKSYYASHLPALKLDQAFAWNAGSLPAAFKPGSISYLLAVQVAILSGISLAAAVYYFGLLFKVSVWLPAVIGGYRNLFIPDAALWAAAGGEEIEMTAATEDLEQRQIPFRLFRHAGPVELLEQAAAERGQQPGQVIRTILFRLGQDDFVLVLMAGPRQISWPALRRYLGQNRLTMATPDEVKAATGYVPGTVSPFGLPPKEGGGPRPIRTLVDSGVTAFEEVSLGSGERGLAIVMSSAGLLRALGEVEMGEWGG